MERYNQEISKTDKLEKLLNQERGKILMAETIHKGKESNSLNQKVEYQEDYVQY